jgi:hypothetical protein
VTPSDVLSPPRRPIFFPVVIATVFLTIIGMVAGFMLGERDRNDASSTGPLETSPPVETSSAPSPSGPPCPDEAIEFARSNKLRSDLTQVIKIVTANETTVWICRDGGGGLYYQSKTGGVDAPLIQGKNGLFLTGVRDDGDNEFEATATNGNRFVVNTRVLEVHFASGKPTQTNKVTSAE